MRQAQPVAIVPAVTTQTPSAHPLPASTLSVAATDPAPAKATPIVVPATIRSPSDSVTHAELTAALDQLANSLRSQFFSVTESGPFSGAPKVLMTYAFLENAGGGTHIEIRVAKPKPKDKAFLEQVGAEFQKSITSEVATLRLLLEGQKGAPAVVEEPTLPISAERFLTQPVHAH